MEHYGLFRAFLSISPLCNIHLLGRGFPLWFVVGKLSHGAAEPPPKADLGTQGGLPARSPPAASQGTFRTVALWETSLAEVSQGTEAAACPNNPHCSRSRSSSRREVFIRALPFPLLQGVSNTRSGGCGEEDGAL